MSPRYRRARELAGLSLGQASRLLDIGLVRLSDIELKRREPENAERIAMADRYGCTLAWLDGATPAVPDDIARVIRDAALPDDDHARLLELLGSMTTTIR